VEREATPYGECEENNDPKHNVYAEKYPVVYSKQVMQRAMRQTSAYRYTLIATEGQPASSSLLVHAKHFIKTVLMNCNLF